MNAEKKIEKKYVETPLMKQYYSIKAVHPDAILLFRVGDFYETFGEDAIKASGILGITLTRRANGSATYVELAGFPYHAIDTYLPKLVRAGERVAICEQLEDPKQVRGLVKRGVIELVTPGVVLGDNILANKENAFLASVYFGRQTTGVAFLDISTGEFYVAEGSESYIDKLISNLAPKEVIYQRGYEDRFSDAFGSKLYTYRLDEWVFSEEVNREKLCKQFGTRSLKGFGVDHFTSGLSAAGAILYYLEFTEHRDIAHITSISRIDQEDYVWVDKFTIRNLELFSSNGAREKCSFADVIDRTLTPMGGRLLKRWIAMPIKDPVKIGERLDVVDKFVRDADLADVVREQVALVGDMERIASRIAAARVTPRELVQLKKLAFRRRAAQGRARIDRRRAVARTGRTDRPAGRGARPHRPRDLSRSAQQPDSEGRRDRRRRGPRTGRSAPHRPPRQGLSGPHPAARERGDGHSFAENQLQQRLRLLYRGAQRPQGEGAGDVDLASRRWPMPNAISPRS